MFKGFRTFISRGNAIELAVGVIIGGAFGRVVNSLVADVIMPVIGRVFGEPDFSRIVLFASAPDSGGIDLGQLLTAITNLLIVGFALYLTIILPMNALRKKQDDPALPAEPPRDIQLLTEIRDLLAKQD
ncbi:MAG TPA: large conductance mechanosensitive channel protein MscL [Spirochaetia bacterium]|nr:large conductance mechanosensitive channel protein MscL [Spirochaetia bacterium]